MRCRPSAWRLDEAIAASIAAYVRPPRRRLSKARTGTSANRPADLREADRRKNEFLAVLAHELRNPMAPILNTVEVLKLARARPTPTSHQARDIVERQVKQMVRLVDDLLDLTRIAEGKIELRRTTFDLAAAVAEAIQTMTPLFEAQGHQLSVSLPTEPLRMEGDQARIVQVLVNLLTNAGKYTDKGGRIRLTAGREGDEIVLTVRTTAWASKRTCWTAYSTCSRRSTDSRPRSRGGLGIGLTLVRQLVQLHGGRVVGCTATGRARAASSSCACPPSAAPPNRRSRHGPAAGNSFTHPDYRGQHRRPFDVATVADTAGPPGRCGRRRAAGRRGGLGRPAGRGPGRSGPAVMDGLEVARRLRAGLGDAVLLVALTGHASEEDRRGCLDAGFDDHLAKPVDLDALNRARRRGRTTAAINSERAGLPGRSTFHAITGEQPDLPAASR